MLGATVALILLVGAGCGTGSTPEDPAAPEPGTSSAPVAPPPSPTPEPLSKDAYQKLLTASEAAVRKGFDQVMAAKSIKEVQAAADKLAGVMSGEAQKINTTEAPDEALAADGELLRLLKASAPKFEPSNAKANECGLKPSTTEQVIQAKRAVHESVKPDGLKHVTAQFKKIGYRWGQKLLPAKPEPPAKKKRRADNGEVIERNGSRGSRFLKIKNDTPSDYVVAAVTKNPKKPMASIYVRANSDTTLYNLAAKTYTVYYKTGTDWDDDRKTFTRGCAFQKFQLSFLPQSNWEIELKKRIGGNASTQPTEPF
ncbi:hypothetical protein GCM10028864_15160 [Microlunatus parietis]